MESQNSSTRQNSQEVNPAVTIPQEGFMRLQEVLRVFPISKATWYIGVKAGRFPAGVRLSENTTAYRVEDIRKLIESTGK